MKPKRNDTFVGDAMYIKVIQNFLRRFSTEVLPCINMSRWDAAITAAATVTDTTNILLVATHTHSHRISQQILLQL